MSNNKEDHDLTGKIIVQGTVINKTPLLISTGEGEVVDFEVICDSKGNPYIPASGVAGMLRNSMTSKILTLDREQVEQLRYFWGSEKYEDKNLGKDQTNAQLCQSHIIIDNLYLKENSSFKKVIRDSVRIDETSNLAVHAGKMDYEQIEPGAQFCFYAEITIRKCFDSSMFKEYIGFIIKKLRSGSCCQGAFKSSGLGKIFLTDDIEIYEFEFPRDSAKWFKFLQKEPVEKNKEIYSTTLCEQPRKILNFLGRFSIKSSLIIREENLETMKPGETIPDKIHILRDKNALITGKTLKGIIRHRALKILNTLEVENTKTFIDNLFGFTEGTDQKPSKVTTFESEFENADIEQVQPRVKIDRFTGGTIPGALMTSRPVWHKGEEIELKFSLEKWSHEEAGLLLLVMKDMMNEDLPIGGEKAIGRGILTGKQFTVSGSDGKSDILIEFDQYGLKDKRRKEQIELVNGWVESITKNENE
ncbi:MAG: RAMP superfamily CRISPR-associated protein [Bacteroidales bacterium]|nr:RAMP superfamily CRISPR-associated protein [Bacteroidales bacterium]